MESTSEFILAQMETFLGVWFGGKEDEEFKQSPFYLNFLELSPSEQNATAQKYVEYVVPKVGRKPPKYDLDLTS